MSADNVASIGRPYAAPEPSLDRVNDRLHTHMAALRCVMVTLQMAAEERGPLQDDIAAAARVVGDAVRGLESALEELDGWQLSHQEVRS